MELLQEISRIYYSLNFNNRASRLNKVAPFLSELSKAKPNIVRSKIIFVVSILDSEEYMLRNAVVNTIVIFLERIEEENHDKLCPCPPYPPPPPFTFQNEKILTFKIFFKFSF